jgi:hypothetical protein
MEILSQDDMDARISSARPLGDKPSSLGTSDSLWNIPCPWEPGAFISTEKAKRYAAELRALVAESEARYLKREYDREVERNKTITAQLHERADKAEKEQQIAWGETVRFKKKLQKVTGKRQR